MSGPAALAHLSGAYTINSALPTAGTNYASFTAAATALATGVSGGPYTEQLKLPVIAGTSATNRVTFNGNGRTIQYMPLLAAEPAVVTLNGADFITLNNLNVTALPNGVAGWGGQLVNNADNNVVSNCTVTCGVAFTNAGIVSGASTTSITGTGATANQNVTITGNTVQGGYYGIVVTGNTAAAPTPGVVITNNTVRDFYQYGLYVGYLTGPQIVGNEVSRPTAASVTTYYGIYLNTGVSGAAVEKNRLHGAFAGTTSGASYGIYVGTGTAATAASPNDIVNNLIYDIASTGGVYGLYNQSSAYTRYYHNTVDIDAPANASTSSAYGFYQLLGPNVEFLNNVVRINRGGAAPQYGGFLSTNSAGSTISNYNDLSGQGSNYVTGAYALTGFPTLAAWKTANNAAFDQASIGIEPTFVSVATGDLRPTASALNGAATPLTRVPQDFTGAVRSTTAPDMGAYEFTPPALDVALLSIDAPTSPVVAGPRPVVATILNNGGTALTSVRLQYVLNGGTPVAQTFALSSLAPGATQSLTFSTSATLLVGSDTVTVTASLPNGQPDGNAFNNSQTVTFDQLTPANDEPCGALALTGPVTSSNVNCTTSSGGGIANSLPACSGAQLPKDVWFSWTPGASNATLYFSGSPSGMVRVFTAATCSTAFVQVACRTSAAANTSLGAVALTGLTTGQRYYLAVSGFGTNDLTGSFTIGLAPLSTRPQANASALQVFPNPTATGAFTLRLVDGRAHSGSLTLLNALGQVVRTQPLTNSEEQPVSTRGLAPGLYTLLVQAGSKVLTHKVVVE